MYYIISTLLFLISPVLGGLFAFFYVLNKKRFKTQEIFFLIVLFSTLLGILNACKIPESDLEVYKIWYEDVAHYSFYNYLFYLGKEPLFFLYNYLMYYISFGFFELYLVLNTMICYSIMGFSLVKMHRACKLPKEYFFLSMLSLFLFPNLFSLSAHLIRQFLAASLLMLFIVDFTFYNKNRFVLLGTAMFIHTSSVLYSFSYLLKKIKSNKLVILTVTIVFGILSLLIFKITNLSFIGKTGTSTLNYGISRIQNRFEAIELETLGALNYLLFIFIAMVFYLLSQNLRIKTRSILLYVSLLFLTFITVNYSDTELALRFSFFMYFLFPISIYFFLKFFKVERFVKNKRILTLVFFISFLVWFVYKIYYGVWKYENVERLLFSGFW